MDLKVVPRVINNKINNTKFFSIASIIGELVLTYEINKWRLYKKDGTLLSETNYSFDVGKNYVLNSEKKLIFDIKGNVFELNTKNKCFKFIEEDYIITISEPDLSKKRVLEKKSSIVSPLNYCKKGLVSIELGEVYEPIYDELDYLDNGLFRAKLEGKYGILDGKGNTIVNFIYDELIKLSDDVYYVVKDKKSFCINSKEEKLFDLPFVKPGAKVEGYVNGMANYYYKKTCGYFDLQGNLIKKFNSACCSSFLSDRAIICNNKYNSGAHEGNAYLIDSSMKKVSKHYAYIKYIGRGLYCVSQDKKQYFVIDKNDKAIIPPSKKLNSPLSFYGQIEDIDEEICKKNSKKFLNNITLIFGSGFNPNGRIFIVDKEFKKNIGDVGEDAYFYDFNGKYTIVLLSNKDGSGVIDKKGKWFVAPVHNGLVLSDNIVSIDGDLYEIENKIKTAIDIIIFDDNHKELFSTQVYSKSKANKYRKEIEKIIKETKKKTDNLKEEINKINNNGLEQIKDGIKNNFQNIFEYEYKSNFNFSDAALQMPLFGDKDETESEITTDFSYKI